MVSGRKITIEFLGKDTSAGKAASEVEQKFGKLGGRLDKVGRAAGKILAVGVLAGGAALYKMGQAAADDELAQSKLAQSLKVAAGASDEQVAATERWITAQGKALGMSDDELRPALAKLATATGDVGEAQRLAAIAMDVAAARGVSLETVTNAMARAQTGSVAGLGRLGVATKNAAGETLSLEQITKNMAATYKGAASNAADTTAGKQKKLSVAFSELQEQIGQKVLPAMLKLSEVGLKGVDWISKNTTMVGTFIAVIGGGLAILWSVSAAMRAWSTITAIWSGVTKVAAAVQWALNAAMAANPIGLVVIAIAALVAGLIIAYKQSKTFRKIVDAAFGAVAKAAKAAFGWIKGHWKLLLAIITGPIGIAVLIVTKNWGKIKAGAAAVLGWIRSAWKVLKEVLTAPFHKALEVIRGVWGNLKEGAQLAKSYVVERFNDLVGFFAGLPERMGRVTSGLFNGITSGFRSAINFVIAGWNGLSFSLPGFNPPGPGSIPGFTVGTPDIPYLAKGGIVRARKGGTLALIGEGGHDEAVVPLSGPHARGMGGGVTIIIQGAVDPVGTARQIEKILVQAQRSTGSPYQFRTA